MSLSFIGLLFWSLPLFAQDKNVSGTVLAQEDNSPLQSVTVTNRNTNQRTQTNAQGYYSIPAVKGQVLIFTFVGYVRGEATVGDASLVNLKLISSEGQLGEVVVTAYGIKRDKKGLGSAVQEVKGEEIAQTRRDNFINSLAGRVPGATINTTSGAPGASTSIILRGGSAVSLSNQPLFVIDGVPLDNNVVNQDRDNLLSRSTANRSDDFTNRASDINPEDIETLTILKGPEAQALYGTDAANGAILITTKKGKAGKATVTYDNSLRIEQLYRFHETQTTYARGATGIRSDLGGTTAFGEGGVVSPNYFGPKYPDTTAFFDNIKNFFKRGITQQHNLGVEGGNEGFTYRVNAGYTKQSGTIPSTGYDRFSLRVTGDAKMSLKSRLTTSFNYITTATDKASKGIGSYYLSTLTWPVNNNMSNYLNPDGTRKLLLGTSRNLEYDNPYWDVNKNDSKDKTNRFLGNVTYSYDAAKWMNITGIASVDNYTTTGFQVTHPQSRYGVSPNGFFSQYDLIYRQLTGNIRTTLKKNFKNIKNTLTLGFYTENNRRVVNAFKGERFFELDVASINNTDPISRDASNQQQESRKQRGYAQYQFNWKDIIIPTLSVSYEGNSVLLSRFVDKNPFYTFGSGALAFNIGEFEFVKDKKIIDLLKLRTSYSTSGQTAGLLPYNIDPSFQSVTTTGGGYGYRFTGNNFSLKPQFTKSFEYGLEFSMFKKRIGGNVTIYNNKTTDQIFFPRVSYGAGFVLKYFNGGDIQNKGMELQLTGSPILTKKFAWDITFNYDHFKNKVLKLNTGPGGYYDSDTWVYGSLRSQTTVGGSIYQLFGTAFAKNINGDLLISPTTGLPQTTGAIDPINGAFVPVGDRAPDFSIGIQNSVRFKGFTLSFNLDIRKGGDIFNGTELALYRNGLSTRTLDRETPRVIKGVLRDGFENTANPTPNNIVIIPYFRNDYYNGTSGFSAGIVEADFVEKDINWVRMRDATLSYRFSNDLIKRIRMKSASIFVTATDLFLLTNYSGADPSVSANNPSGGGIGGIGIDYGAISTPRTLNMGLRVSF
ncbi:MAG: SusC/RagA family TonB-linked outer membrane protein [Chitinophagaceae bacterium]